MKFDACETCGGTVRRRRVTVDFRRRNRLYIFYKVPIGVCTKCGERYYPGPVLERLDELAEHGMEKGKTLAVPTLDYASVA
jgi:YgiT-type zinc finger domain-containing protein